MQLKRTWTAAVLIIGDEILSGRTRDENVAPIAIWLNEQGIRLAEVRMVADALDVISKAVNELRRSHDYLITTGGIGPTHDDITVDGVAAAFETVVEIIPEARAILERFFRDVPGGLSEAHLRLARAPSGAEVIQSPTSPAIGFRLDNVFILAGVPRIAASMLENLSGKLLGGRPLVSVTVSARVRETEVAQLLRDTEEAHPGAIIGSYPFFKQGNHGCNFVIRCEDQDVAEGTGKDLINRLRLEGFDPIEGGS